MFIEVCTAAMSRLRRQAEPLIQAGNTDPLIQEQMREPLVIDDGLLYFEDEIRSVGRSTIEMMSYLVDREGFVNKLPLNWLLTDPNDGKGKPTESDFEAFGIRCVAQGVLLARRVLISAKRVTQQPQIAYITLDFGDGDYEPWYPSATFRFTAYRFGLAPGGEWTTIDPADNHSHVMSIRLEKD
ncbi:hypothetical protein [Psychromicrobium lacuslunae]|uniref:Uncharacterized protein n=1 Tax=Psychromicrobium lacuslunae TaxID=1618207 RepID=A0A0D4BX60_9MICC|nr:hypothetical protein [Psychromicrobium lacuslunae]AJT40913.1 hypothetical protein UM93_04195 [Psychromicrobium lacuslunae]